MLSMLLHCSISSLSQNSLPMNKETSLQNAFSARRVVAAHEVTDSRSEAMLQTRLLCNQLKKNQCKVEMYTHAHTRLDTQYLHTYSCSCIINHEEWVPQILSRT